ncbi:MAG: AAA family ATPase [Bacteroidetes bacterium]|nr:AAA family ATPase [Bacteroidota bacterium]
MKIISINIKNFRSLKDLTLPIQSYGNGINESKATFLVGINESGKSAILDAINLISNGMDGLGYQENCFIAAQDEDEYIDIYTDIDIEWQYHKTFWRKQIAEKIKLDEKIANQIDIIRLVKNTYKYSDGANDSYDVSINHDLPLYQYIVNTTQKTVGSTTQKTETIENLVEFNKITEIISAENAEKFLLENQKILTNEKLESIIASNLKTIFNHNLPKIQIWKSKPEYLINEVVDLDKFKDDTNLSIPLKNIFHIYGKTKDEEIKSTIEKALSNQARCDELQEKISDKVTKYINKIWKEHKIKIKVSINSNLCKVHVEDNDKKYAYYTMSQRSDGFKQFLSLILSISVQNETNNLKNNIILIDEPEVHLHPSGIKYLRDEILKIGKNNFVILSTHSHYMIDTETPDRHWIVQKQKSETKITQITEEVSITDDKVIAAAFGLNLFKELLPKNIIIVEGADDKNVISHSLYNINNSFKYSIKEAGGASKAPGFARLLNDEKITAFILFDADKEGRDNKKNILDNQGTCYSISNVFTIKDILNTLPDDSTIEDLMPLDIVKPFFDNEMGQDFELTEDKAVIQQIKNQSELLKNNKQKLDSLKIKLSVEFLSKYNTKKKIEDHVNKMVLFSNQLIARIENFERPE